MPIKLFLNRQYDINGNHFISLGRNRNSDTVIERSISNTSKLVTYLKNIQNELNTLKNRRNPDLLRVRTLYRQSCSINQSTDDPMVNKLFRDINYNVKYLVNKFVKTFGINNRQYAIIDTMPEIKEEYEESSSSSEESDNSSESDDE